ncbi:hypothetical protein [Flavobacterium sp.]|uniref:hypothetical protein n=1 Tax=Flavobacterium sp. TaxID=239 RepID=UPI004034249D
MHKYDKEILFARINGGLDYIHEVYPQSVGFEDRNKHFKIRDERSPSTSLYKENDIYYVKDHGGGKALNAINLCMQEENLTFLEAMKFLYQKYGLEPKTMAQFKPVREYKATELDIDHYDIDYHDVPVRTEIFAPFLTPYTCGEYGFESVMRYETVSYKKDDKGNPTEIKQLNIVVATDDYPIFAFVGDGFVKIYEPLNDKQYRFRFLGKKPQRHIYGWQRLFDKVNFDRITQLRDQIRSYPEDSESKGKKAMQDELDELLLKDVYIASGGSDGLNLASLGKDVIWFNSESEQIEYAEYRKLSEICKNIYNVPDLDTTGVKQGVKLGLEHLEMKTVWLPAKLKENDKKDFRDWIGLYKHLGVDKAKTAFDKLVNQALEFRWWRWNKKTSSWKYNYVSLIYFLEHQGFNVYQLKHKNQQKGAVNYIFIKIDGNVVREVTAPEIKGFVIEWLKENQITLDVLNMVIGSQFLSEKNLLSLPIKDIDFTIATQKDQLFFFNNKVIKVTAEKIEEVSPGKIRNYIWSTKVKQHNIKVTDPQFNISKDAAGNWDIEVLEKNNMFLNYLINASRIHWRNELEKPFEGKSDKVKQEYHDANRFNIAGSHLSDEEKYEQKLHLINKIFCIGYLLHSYKDDAKPWCLYVMDNKLPEVSSESHGGSGKSFGVGKVQEHFKNSFYLEGRNYKLQDNQFIYDGVDEDTDTIFLDDAHYSTNFGFYFSMITGNMRINPKHGKQFELPFDRSPKLVITTNFVPANLDPSTLRRLLIMVYSDYYHEKTDEYKETRQITDDFGGKKMFREEFTREDYNLFYNFCLQALKFYMSCTEKIAAPDGNVKLRNLMQLMGDNFYEWAKGYFGEDKLNTYIARSDVQNDYKNFVGGKTMTANKQKVALDAFCKFNGWQLNPAELLGSDKTIKRARNDHNGTRQILEHYYINTTGNAVTAAEVSESDLFATANQQTVATAEDSEVDTDVMPF